MSSAINLLPVAPPPIQTNHDARPSTTPLHGSSMTENLLIVSSALPLTDSRLFLTPTDTKNDIDSPQVDDRWVGCDRRKLSEDGYRALAILATFLAGTQAQVLSSVPTGNTSEIVTAFFMSGLFLDLFGAVLSFGSARWFEMLTQEEAKYLHQCWVGAETGRGQPVSSSALVDRWISISIWIGPYTVGMGLVCFVLGLLVSVWAQSSPIVKCIATIICGIFFPLIPPFALRHDRRAVLDRLRLKRRSG